MGDYKPITDAALDKSWSDYGHSTHASNVNDKPILARCKRVEIRKPKGRVSIVMTLVDATREFTCWFNVLPIKGKNKEGECRMSRDCKLANLYRTTLGKSPSRYNRARQAANHLVEELFFIKIKSSSSRGLEVSSISPRTITPSKTWGATGKLYQTRSYRKAEEGLVKQRQNDGKHTAEGRQDDGKGTVMDSSLAITVKGLQPESITTNQLTHNKSPTTSELDLVSDSETKAIGTNKTSRYFRRDDEPICDYYDRVIDESGFLE